MALYTFTAAEVLAAADGTTHTAGEAITAGQFCYIDATDGNKAKVADNETQIKAAVVGIALNDAADDQPVNLLSSGEVTVDAATFTNEAQILTLAATGDAGKCEDCGDLGAGEFGTILGWSTDADKFTLNINKTGLAFSAP
jgi:hypothetical protein